jgi:hypothetical protein
LFADFVLSPIQDSRLLNHVHQLTNSSSKRKELFDAPKAYFWKPALPNDEIRPFFNTINP